MVWAGEKLLGKFVLTAGSDRQEIGPVALPKGERVVIRIEVIRGRIELEEILTES